VAVGQMRAIEFVADAPGDWALHCHKLHHTMGPMGHQVPPMLGADQRDLQQRIRALVPEYMAMGHTGMAEMGAMEMPLPDNTLPMMTGQGPFGALEMGGMVSLLKVRDQQKPGDYTDPGWYQHPAGTLAHEWTGPALPEPAKAAAATGEATIDARKPTGQSHH